jgi:hypothetical protein
MDPGKVVLVRLYYFSTLLHFASFCCTVHHSASLCCILLHSAKYTLPAACTIYPTRQPYNIPYLVTVEYTLPNHRTIYPT